MTAAITTTKHRILVAGLRLFGELGYAGTSMRAITEAAGVNIASVNYHFGRKTNLFRAVVEFAMAEVNTRRAELLDAMLQETSSPSADDLVDAFVRTGVEIIHRPDGLGPEVARFVGRVICEPQPETRRLFGEEVASVERRYLGALEQALPQLSPSEVEFRYRAMVGLLALHQSSALADLLPGGRPSGTTRDGDEAERLRRVIQGIFGITPTGSHPA